MLTMMMMMMMMMMTKEMMMMIVMMKLMMRMMMMMIMIMTKEMMMMMMMMMLMMMIVIVIVLTIVERIKDISVMTMKVRINDIHVNYADYGYASSIKMITMHAQRPKVLQYLHARVSTINMFSSYILLLWHQTVLSSYYIIIIPSYHSIGT